MRKGNQTGKQRGRQRATKGQHTTKEQGNKGTEKLIHTYAPTPEHVSVPPGEGYTPLPHGAWLNGESVWHPKFTISLASAKMQFALANLGDIDIAAACKAAAIQWAAEIEGGKPAEKVVPGNIIGAIIGGVRKGTYSAHEHQVRLAKVAAGNPTKTFRR